MLRASTGQSLDTERLVSVAEGPLELCHADWARIMSLPDRGGRGWRDTSLSDDTILTSACNGLSPIGEVWRKHDSTSLKGGGRDGLGMM